MNPRDIRTAPDPDIAATEAAMLEAAQMAEDLAIRTDTAIITTVNGRLVRITAAELQSRRMHESKQGEAEPEARTIR